MPLPFQYFTEKVQILKKEKTVALEDVLYRQNVQKFLQDKTFMYAELNILSDIL